MLAWSYTMSAKGKRYSRHVAYWLIQYPCHTVDQELEVLRTVQTAKEMAEEILGCRAVARFRYGVQDQYQE